MGCDRNHPLTGSANERIFVRLSISANGKLFNRLNILADTLAISVSPSLQMMQFALDGCNSPAASLQEGPVQ